jgi:hypothetical protein
MEKELGTFNAVSQRVSGTSSIGEGGDKACAVFEYTGPALPKKEAERLISA